jgi:hypothetical protein
MAFFFGILNPWDPVMMKTPERHVVYPIYEYEYIYMLLNPVTLSHQ